MPKKTMTTEELEALAGEYLDRLSKAEYTDVDQHMYDLQKDLHRAIRRRQLSVGYFREVLEDMEKFFLTEVMDDLRNLRKFLEERLTGYGY